MKKETELFNIRKVIELTGVTEFTLRGWETRYLAFAPHRTETGRRLYHREDILKIKALKDLVNRGYRIGSIASLGLTELQVLLDGINPSEIDPIIDPDISKILKLAERFEWDQIQKLIIRKRTKLSPVDFILTFILNLIHEVNILVELQQFSIAQEHILSSMIKENIFFLKTTAPSPHHKNARIVFAAPEGDLHENGLLIAATLASLAKIPNIYIGVNTPKNHICDVCLRFKATHLILTSTVSKEEGAKEDLMNFINFLDRHLPQSMTLWIGGRNSMKHSFGLGRSFNLVSSLHEQNEMFEKLRKQKP